MPVANYYKYILLVLTVMVIGGAGIILTLMAFATFGIIIAGFIALMTLGAIIGVMNKFLSEGVPNYTYEEEIAREGTNLVRHVIIKSPKYDNLIYFDKIGQMTPTQRGVYFYYGYPFLFGKKKMIINNLTEAELASNPIIIEGMLHYYPNELYVETNHAIKIKGAVSSWQEIKQYDAATEMVANNGTFVREIMAGVPELKSKIAHDITIDDLTKKGF